MNNMVKTQRKKITKLHYADKRAIRRQIAAAELSKRVVNPVQLATSEKTRTPPPVWAVLGGFGVIALLFHGALAGTLMALSTPHETRTLSENVVFQVVEPVTTPAPEPVEPAPAPESELEPKPEIAPEPEPIAAPMAEPLTEQVPPKQPKPRRVRMAMADPVNASEPNPTPEPKKRAVVGITMSSTVTGGNGPAYAVGNTRMGSTARVQSKEKIERLTRGKISGPGGDSGTATVAVNKKATFIPTVSSSFARPRRLSAVDLPYPPALKSKGIEGNVMVLIVIDEKGLVQKVRILKSSGYREFDEAALKAARKEMYSPARRDGKPVEYNLKYTYRFRMKGA